MNKTLIGKNKFLFLINDNSDEIVNHCKKQLNTNEIMLIHHKIKQLSFQNYLLIVIPDKSIFYKEYLPDIYNAIYRNKLSLYQKNIPNKVVDVFNLLQKNKNDLLYYKTDTHINLLGNYYIYQYFIKQIQLKFNIDIKPKSLHIQKKRCNLLDLKIGIGDLLWDSNCKIKMLNKNEYNDVYYSSDDINYLYMKYVISDSKDIKFLDYSKHLNDVTQNLNGKVLNWNIISKYIIYKKNEKIGKKIKVVIFYDSMLLNILELYLELFHEVFMIKNSYNNNLIGYIKPDYVFEFRIERFL